MSNTPNIVVLDGYTLSPATVEADQPGQPSWQALAALGSLTVYERTPSEAILERAQNAEIVLTNKTPLTKQTLDQLDALQYVGVLATGVNVVDLDAAKANNVTVTNVPAYSTMSVAQHVFALLLEMTLHIGPHNASVHQGDWVNCQDFAYTLKPTHELAGKKLGIVGMGAIGQAVARIGITMGMEILCHSRTPKTLDHPATWLELDELFEQADVISLHCPLTKQTQHMVNEVSLARMKPGSWIINTGRGPLLDEQAVAEALKSGQLAGAGVDVLSTEPPAADNPLLDAPNCVITPHAAWATMQARQRLMDTAVQNVQAFLAGQAQNVVNP